MDFASYTPDEDGFQALFGWLSGEDDIIHLPTDALSDFNAYLEQKNATKKGGFLIKVKNLA